MLKRIIIALAIFSFMFVGAWMLNEQLDDVNHFEIHQEPVGTSKVQSNDQNIVVPKQEFRPRQYIRIEETN